MGSNVTAGRPLKRRSKQDRREDDDGDGDDGENDEDHMLTLRNQTQKICDCEYY